MTPKAILILLSIVLLIIYIIMSYKIYKLKEQHLKTLQELVDKETPKEVIIDDVYEDGSFGCSCPNCRMYLPSYKTNRCSSCGQALKWKD
jgi:hypothetical protein